MQPFSPSNKSCLKRRVILKGPCSRRMRSRARLYCEAPFSFHMYVLKPAGTFYFILFARMSWDFHKAHCVPFAGKWATYLAFCFCQITSASVFIFQSCSFYCLSCSAHHHRAGRCLQALSLRVRDISQTREQKSGTKNKPTGRCMHT